MKHSIILLSILIVLLVVAVSYTTLHLSPSPTGPSDIVSQLDEYASPEARATKKARDDYFYRMLRSPETKNIPVNIRQRELDYAASLPKRSQILAKRSAMSLFNWHEAGPSDVGGRTRAVAVDRTNSNVIIAGGVSGGIWKSTDRGATWTLKSGLENQAGITSIAQDPTNNSRWFASTGEFSGSNADRGFRAFYYGPGIYRSTDNGENWELLKLNQNPVSFDSPFDYTTKILVSPTTGTTFIASNGFSLLRSINPGTDLSQVLGRSIFPMWTDFDIASNGNIIAVTSEGFETDDEESPGVFFSTNDGQTWQDITPAGYPDTPNRSVIAFAPSDPTVAYLWTFTGVVTSGNNAFEEVEEMQFYKFTLPAGTSENRSANLPDFGGQVGQLYSQGGYDMALAVKPDDPNFVVLGGTNLFRSRDGFATAANAAAENWIGGYATQNNISQYANHHPDQHALFFDPQAPNALWSGHDGGLSFVSDITASGNTVPWQNKNNGFNVTQFYHVAIPAAANDDRILGGTQDNGSPFFSFDAVSVVGSPSNDVSSGDGGYAFMGATYAVASTQNGEISAYQYDATGDLLFLGDVTPAGAANQLFIHPFAADPNDESILYYPAGRNMWRRNAGLPSSGSWTQLSSFLAPSNYTFSAVASGRRGGASVVYAGASGVDLAPRLYRLDNADTSTEAPVQLSFPGPLDAYVHSIAVNPDNGDEILVALSNYEIVGLYHSNDAGASFTAVEGNLEGSAENPGPSLRSVAILPLGNITAYLVGTSTGLYSSETLNGGGTVWTQEADQELGHAIVESIAARTSDGRVALGTHGRGIFVGTPLNAVANEDEGALPEAFTLEQNYPNPFNPSTTLGFTMQAASRVSMKVYDAVGRHVATLLQDAIREPGSHTLEFDAGSLPSGAYVYRLEATPLAGAGETYTTSRTMVLSK